MKRILALGTESKTSFSTLDDNGLFISDPVDDLTNVKNFARFEGVLKEHMKKKSFIPETIACDLHPDYISTALAEEMKKKGAKAKIVRVQHHFAHIVSCMQDNDIDENVIGVSFDGTGYGTDGKIWGSEFMVCDRSDFERRYHLQYVPQPGGDAAAREGWRMALAYLYKLYGDKIMELDIPVLKRIGEAKASVIMQMMQNKVNSPETSSMGRLFDAVSAMTGICDESSFEAEAAISLEKETAGGVLEYYEYDISGDEIIVSKMIDGICREVANGVGRDLISAKFHNTIGEMVLDVCSMISDETGIKKVLLSGGCFQNSYLMDYIEDGFEELDLELYTHKNLPTTDLNISVGQAVVASNYNKIFDF